MNTTYEQTKTKLTQEINAQKSIHKFRMFLYSVNKDIRNHLFSISHDYLYNELQNNALTVSERNRLQQVISHWHWNDFELNGSNWWYILSHNHSKCLTLLTLIHTWIDDMNVFDPESIETSTLGLQ